MSALIDPELASTKLQRFANELREIDFRDLATSLEHAYLLLQPPTARPRSEWSVEDGAVLWWHFPVQEPPYCGQPDDSGFAEKSNYFGPRTLPDGYYTHWTPIVVPNPPADWTPPRENQCRKCTWCCSPDGHEGECDEIPF